ncbi:hypothetical protein BU24DRAFT_425841 [Aaosphaeria arxii CBS 175.79]|uniref:Uncharacterized protein n=1 Tax=Aaosphaeria arxii CBS 175.79 TaxID=1450172 RepID=A0A6A5XG12_9PLEO|nr:uncharacterized protein BU24DRAFT_425841 [Aaosphaeria arxii CBS 175.79]KAF2012022.1 hypothetical protein BU24DRAFT_425841 [Aaosphaeria arxii CBS 175.79]
MEEDDIAAAMGFSSFGGAKKRKFDATISPKAKLEGSGANSTKLGVRTTAQSSEGQDSVESNQQDGTSDVLPTTETAQANRKGKQRQPPPATGLADFLNRGQSLPDKPADAPAPASAHDGQAANDQSEMVSFGGPPISKAELSALRRGVANEEGDVAYFLPTFIEDPWERLQKA